MYRRIFMNSGFDRFTPILEYLVFSDFKPYTFWIMYGIILILSVIAYKLGFARKLPLLKSIFVYILLTLGTFITATLSILRFPIAESLIVIVIVLAIYRFRLHLQRKRNQVNG